MKQSSDDHGCSPPGPYLVFGSFEIDELPVGKFRGIFSEVPRWSNVEVPDLENIEVPGSHVCD
jgi:hypothetical protein